MDVLRVPAALDRIEGGIAVLEMDGGTAAAPAELLPEGAREGVRLIVLVSPGGEIIGTETDREGTEAAAVRIHEKKRRLARRFRRGEPPDGQRGGQQ